MEPHLQLSPGQQALTPAQDAEAQRFAEERIAAQLSTTPVNEPEAERLLRQAYAVAGLSPPPQIRWVDGPLQLVAVLAPRSVTASLRDSVGASVEGISGTHVWPSVLRGVTASVETGVAASVGWGVRRRVWEIMERRHEGLRRVRGTVLTSVWDNVGAGVAAAVAASVGNRVDTNVWTSVTGSVGRRVGASVMASVAASYEAPRLAFFHFFDMYLAPNALNPLAHFNALVSGYWLGQETALLVRRPRWLALDATGRLHSATGTCVEYPDGWGCYAWHGARVPEKVILKPERLTRKDFLNAPNVEVRRVIQERMGQRFVSELGGVALDTGPRGTLYEVRLPQGDPEGVARYVQLQDASTERQYFLRVPPTIQTAAEAVAWSFQLAVEEYAPAQET